MGVDADSRDVGRLALGTAQLGMPYGVANRSGQPSHAETTAMLDMALDMGITCFDTAAGYGDAESRLGRHLRQRALERRVNVVTKLTVGDIGDEVALRAAVAQCARRLGMTPAAILIHDPDLLEHWPVHLTDALQACVADGLTGAIGASVYHPGQFAAALEHPVIEVVQAPFNVFDRRLEQAGMLQRASRRGVRVMLRSVFLQGLLLLDPGRCPPGLGFARSRMARWHALCASHEMQPCSAALRFVMQRTADETIVVGCESREQLAQLLAAASAPDLPAGLVADLEGLATTQTRLLDPTLWPA